MRSLIWTDFTQAKYGDEYLCLYIVFQKSLRKWYKIITILFSAGGIGSAFTGHAWLSGVIFFLIGVVQIISSIEVYIIHSEKQIEDLHKLRMMYFDRANDLEKLFNSYEKMDRQESEKQFYALREKQRPIEELDLQVNVKPIKKLEVKARNSFNNYINSYYGRREESRTTAQATTTATASS